MQVELIFWRPRAPKSSQLGLLRCGVAATCEPWCKTRKHCKKTMVFGNFWSSWGCGPPPPPSEYEGLYNQVAFTPQATQLHATVAFLGLFIWQKCCNLSCCKCASKQNNDFMKKRTKPCKLRGKAQFWQKAARAEKRPNRIFHWFFTIKSHCACFIWKHVLFSWKQENIAKMQSKPLFLEPQALQKITPETIFSVQTTRKGNLGTFSLFLCWCFSLQATNI